MALPLLHRSRNVWLRSPEIRLVSLQFIQELGDLLAVLVIFLIVSLLMDNIEVFSLNRQVVVELSDLSRKSFVIWELLGDLGCRCIWDLVRGIKLQFKLLWLERR